jgi:hypothetical protein
MQKPDYIPVFVVGAPRSGTHLLATSLAENIDCIYRNEINEFWKSSHPFLKTDFIPASKASAKTIAKKRKQISELMQKGGSKSFYLEKTVSNGLRLAYLRKIFPEAVFIHIIRDGRASAYSIRKQYFGNIHKVTQFEDNEKKKGERWQNILNEIKRRTTKGFNPILLLTGIRRYWRTGLLSMGVLKFATWGPRYPGFEYKSKVLTPLQLAGDHWLTMVNSVKSYFNAHSDDKQLIECRYEDLVKKPDAVLGDIIFRLTDDQPSVLNHAIRSDQPVHSFNALDNEEIKELECVISSMQHYLGYEK